jgi:secretory phospholipase A2
MTLSFIVLCLFIIANAQKSIFIYNGTFWCGPGNIATNYEQLGEIKDVDECCRTHDNNCSYYIRGRSEKYGLINYVPFTRTTCQCDEEFLECLKLINSEQADQVGKAYTTINGWCMNFTGKEEMVCLRRRFKFFNCVEEGMQPYADWVRLGEYTREKGLASCTSCQYILLVVGLNVL